MTIIQFQTSCLRLVFMSGIPRNSERDWRVHLNALHAAVHCFADWFALRLLTSFFRFRSIMKRQQKLSSFFTKREWQVNLKSMKISIRVVQSFNIIVWPSRPFLKWPNLKCHVGHTCVYNTLWPTSRLITEQFQIPHWPYLFKRRKPWSTQQILFNG